MPSSYIRHLNIERFERMLLAETDPDKRAQIHRRRAEERANDATPSANKSPDGDDAGRPARG